MLVERLGQLEMTELENSSLRLQVDDLERALQSVREEAHIENSSFLFELDRLEAHMEGSHQLEEVHIEYTDDLDDTHLMQHQYQSHHIDMDGLPHCLDEDMEEDFRPHQEDLCAHEGLAYGLASAFPPAQLSIH